MRGCCLRGHTSRFSIWAPIGGYVRGPRHTLPARFTRSQMGRSLTAEAAGGSARPRASSPRSHESALDPACFFAQALIRRISIVGGLVVAPVGILNLPHRVEELVDLGLRVQPQAA